MGGKSTLHSAVLKDDTQSVSSAFDLRSWQGLTQVLKTAKEYLTDPAEYASFRNLVLQYAQQGGDVEVKKHIDAIIATFKKEEQKQVPEVPIVHEEKEVVQEAQEEPLSEIAEEKQETFVRGGRRTRPVFGTPQESPTQEVDDVVPPEPVAPAAEQQSAQAVPITKIIEEKSEPSIPPREAVPVEVEPLPDVPKTLEEYKARITEIKRIVHDRIGNPVSLMGNKDGNGKKYMSALLIALKATGAGGAGNAVSAMHDLEEVFSALMKEVEVPHGGEDTEINNNDGAGPVPSMSTEEAQVDVPVIEEIPTEQIVAPVVDEVLHEQIDEVVEEQSVAEAMPVVKESDDVPEVVEQEVEIPINEVVQREDVPEVVERDTVPEAQQDILTTRHESFQNSFQKTDEAISAVVGSVHKTNPLADPNPLASTLVSESDGYDKWSRNPKKEAQEEISKILEGDKGQSTNESSGADESSYEQQSELSSPRITTALNKLLQEWSVFSGSGLFGMGPDGLEHPLYMELAPLSMGEVVAGRWEKSDPKTLRSIKEYIDAWRHEQGVTYMMNETFEHYLRRVVQRIQKRQMR
jgi:hypothetical protein